MGTDNTLSNGEEYRALCKVMARVEQPPRVRHERQDRRIAQYPTVRTV